MRIGCEQRAAAAARAPKAGKAKPAAPDVPARAQLASCSYKDQRDLDRLPGEIERIEARDRRRRGGAPRSRPLRARPGAFAALTRAIEDKRAAKDAAELRWLEVAEMAEGLGR